MEISDKELLAICNLSNLRMEFANLNKNKAERSEDEKDKKNLSNHTIYSLLEKEIESIKLDELGKNTENKDGSKKVPRAFMRKREDELKPYSAVYNSIDELKYTAGIVYEYYEYFKANGEKNNFLEDWEILYGGDGYSITTEFIDYLLETGKKENLNKVLYLEDKANKYIYEIEKNEKEEYELKKKDSDNNLVLPTEEEKKGLQEIYQEIDNILLSEKLYNSREFYERNQETERIIKIGLNIIRVISFIAPPIFHGIKKSREIAKAASSIPELTEKIGGELSEEITKITANMPEYQGIKVKFDAKSFKKQILEKSSKITSSLSKKEITTEIEETIERKINKLFVEEGKNAIKISGVSSSKAKLLRKALIAEMFSSNKMPINAFRLPRADMFNFLGINFESPNKKVQDTIETNLFNGIKKYLQKLGVEEKVTKNITKYLEDTIVGGSRDYLKNLVNLVENIRVDNLGNLFGGVLKEFKILTMLNENAAYTFFVVNWSLEYLRDKIDKRKFSPQEKEKINEMIEELEQIKKGIFEIPFQRDIRYDCFDFGVNILAKVEKKGDKKIIKKIVVCFRNSSHDSQINERLMNGELYNEFILLDLVRGYLLPKILEEEKKLDMDNLEIIVTGFNTGAELAGIFRLMNNCEARVFKTRNLNLDSDVLAFNTKDLSNIFYGKSLSVLEETKEQLYAITRDHTIALVIGYIVSGGTSIVPSVIFSTVTALFYLYGIYIKQKKMEDLYVALCRAGFIDCPKKNNCGKKYSENCEYINKKMAFPPLVKNISEVYEEKIAISLYKRKEEFFDGWNVDEIFIKVRDYLSLLIDGCYLDFKISPLIIDAVSLENGNYRSKKFKYQTLPESRDGKEFKRIFKKELGETESYILHREIYYDFISQDEEYTVNAYEEYHADIYDESEWNNIYREGPEASYRIQVGRIDTRDIPQADKKVDINSGDILSWYISTNHRIQQNYYSGKIKPYNCFYTKGFDYGAKAYLKKEIAHSEYDENKLDMETNFSNVISPDNSEFIFFPLVEGGNNGNIIVERYNNKEYMVSEESISNDYIGSVFRSYMEDYFLKGTAKIKPKLDSYEDDVRKYKNITVKDEIEYEKEINKVPVSNTLKPKTKEEYYYTKIAGHGIMLESKTKGKELNIEFIKKMEEKIFLNLKEKKITQPSFPLFLEILKKLNKEGNDSILSSYYTINNETGLKAHPNTKILRIGHIEDESGSYNEKSLKYLYNYYYAQYNKGVYFNSNESKKSELDRIRRGIIEFKGIISRKGEKNEEKEADKKIVVSQAKIICSRSNGRTSEFIAKILKNATADNKTIGCSKDNIPGINIKKFPFCSSDKNGICKCEIPYGSEWNNCLETSEIFGKIITNKSELKCQKGGTISIVDTNTKDMKGK